MADEQQLALIKQGARPWNDWRARNRAVYVDLSGADLTSADLAGARLAAADLTGSDLTAAHLSRADLGYARLIGANLIRAGLSYANLNSANLTRANLDGATIFGATMIHAKLTEARVTDSILGYANFTGADLAGANLSRSSLVSTNLTHANLVGADLSDAECADSVLADLDLSQTVGLDSITHTAPSALDHRTLRRSGRLPLSFLRGCGLPDQLIDYLPSLLDAGPIQFYSCFISYSTANERFAKRLHADLQDRGVRCWFAPHDMKGGKKIHDQIDEAVRVYDRLLLILSTESMSSPWVETEIKKARQKEVDLRRNVLFPIALVPFSEIQAWQLFDSDRGEDLASAVRKYFIPDFSVWETNHGAYLQSFERLLKSLKDADARTPGEGPARRTA